MPFRAEGPARLQYVRYKPRAMTVEIIERHLHVTETRQQISGPHCVLVVAPSSDAPPAPEAMTAFDLMGHGIMLHPGTWHSIDAYPLGDAPGDYFSFPRRRPWRSCSTARRSRSAPGPPVRGRGGADREGYAS